MNKFLQIFLTCIILILCKLSVCAQTYLNNSTTHDSNIKIKIDALVQNKMVQNKIAGLSIGIVSNNEIYYQAGYGLKNINKPGSVDSLTNFLTCSISKLFTATAIMQLVEVGKIDIDNKLTYYLPEFEMKDERYKSITIEQILTHRSGLPNIWKKNFVKPGNDSTALEEFSRKLKNENLSFEPGVQLSSKTYSNTGYNILGLVIERVSGENFSHYVSEHILMPVGMDNSSFFYNQIDSNRSSSPHTRNWLTGKIKASNYYPDIPQDKPCGNLNSCSVDLCKWMQHNLSIYNSEPNTVDVLQNETLNKMWTTTHDIPPYKTSIGLGWWVYQSDKYGKYVFHVGNDPGYSATLIIFPENNFGIVILCNGEYPKDEVWNHLPFEIIDLFKDEWKN